MFYQEVSINKMQVEFLSTVNKIELIIVIIQFI